MNPFEKPPRPARNMALKPPANPFGEDGENDDITIEFQASPQSRTTNNVQLSRFSPIVSNPQNKHRPFAADVQFSQPTATPLASQQRSQLRQPQQSSQPSQPPRRVFGGSIPLSGDNSPSAVQYRAEMLSQRASPYDSQNDTESEPSPSVRSPFRFLMPARTRYQPANRASPGPPRDAYSDEESSSSSEESDEENSDSEGTDTTAGPSTRSSGSAGVLNDTGIELQTITPPKPGKKSKKIASADTPDTTNTSIRGAKNKKGKKKKARKPRKGPLVCVDEDNENQLIRFLISEKVYGYPNTHGGRCSNYYYYILYNHPILSIFCTHKLHPFSKKHRFIVFLCSLSFAVCFAFILLDTPLVPTFQVCRSVCDCQLVTDDASSVVVASPTNGTAEVDQCVGGLNDGKACSAYNELCNNYEGWMLSAACGAATVLYDSLLHFLATCSCVQGRKRFQNTCCGSRVKKVVEFFGSITLTIFALMSFTLTLFTLTYCYVHRFAAELLVVLVLSELWSSAQWFLWALPWFLYQYPADRRFFFEKEKRRSQKKSRSAEV